MSELTDNLDELDKILDKTNQTGPKVGDLQVWWIPQLGMENTFRVPVLTAEEGCRLFTTLASYDLFQHANRIKPDFSNAGGLSIYVEDVGEGAPGWEEWEDEWGDNVETTRQLPIGFDYFSWKQDLKKG